MPVGTELEGPDEIAPLVVVDALLDAEVAVVLLAVVLPVAVAE